jgi:hypothetical protein
MPVAIKDVDNGLGNVITVTGSLLEKEYLSSLKQHFGQSPEKFAGYRFSLADYSGVAELDLPTVVVRKIADMCKLAVQKNPDVVVANVAQGEFEFGLARMWEMLIDAGSWEVRVFRTVPDAKNWIIRRVDERWGISGLTFEGETTSSGG